MTPHDRHLITTLLDLTPDQRHDVPTLVGSRARPPAVDAPGWVLRRPGRLVGLPYRGVRRLVGVTGSRIRRPNRSGVSPGRAPRRVDDRGHSATLGDPSTKLCTT